ncbi:MAG: amidohydrolase family protein [Gordonia sp. (in: high G+C Gram-positive bacteria)]|uniref:amidohydrolase family protein n=1 Tax=Gordonia sp. (in: high G+C Gram-positive bacteria) TaxID=84139 RepID=UPI0039E33B83
MCTDDVAPFSAAEAERVRRLWQALDLPGLVDVHTHFMPRNVLDKVWAFFDSVGPQLGRDWPITYRADEQVRVDGLDAFGVRAFTSMIYAHKPEMAAWLNAWAVDFAAQQPRCLHTSTFYPEPGAADYTRAAIEAGTRVFKVHVQVGDFSPADPLLTDVWGLIEEADLPVVIHCGSGPAPGRYTGPGPVVDVLRQFPKLRLIIAHMGTTEYADFLEIAEQHENVGLDTTMSFTDFAEQGAPYPRNLLPRVKDLAEKVYWGSDYPNIPYPYGHAIESLIRLDLGDDWLRRVLYRNGADLFSLSS